MSAPEIRRDRTAIRRVDVSRPIRLAIDAGLIREGSTLLDYGCGHGDDVTRLRRRHVVAVGWDPLHRPGGTRRPSEIVNLGYVVNVIENPAERADVLRAAWGFAERLLVVSALSKYDARLGRHEEFADGYLSSRGTFQKLYTQSELRALIDTSLGVTSVPAAPGVFYVFRDDGDRQTYLASRYRRRRAAPKKRRSDELFEQHAELLQPLMDFVADRGRLPERDEVGRADELENALGSIKRAFRIVLRVTGEEPWEEIREERKQDLLVYMALDRFGGRPRMSDLPTGLQRDMRAFFSHYKGACEAADALLFAAGDMETVGSACRASPVGKETPTALYVHETALEHLPPLLRVYEGCARMYVGVVDDANLIKLGRERPKVSYLCYPDFDTSPHPALHDVLGVDLSKLDVWCRLYDKSENPPILHRKEEFVAEDYPQREKFARLTAQEERFGLFEDTTRIGLRQGWEETLADNGVALRGHRVVRRREPASGAESDDGATPTDVAT